MKRIATLGVALGFAFALAQSATAQVKFGVGGPLGLLLVYGLYWILWVTGGWWWLVAMLQTKLSHSRCQDCRKPIASRCPGTLGREAWRLSAARPTARAAAANC